LYDIRPGNGTGQFLQPGARMGLLHYLTTLVKYMGTHVLNTSAEEVQLGIL